MSPLPLVRKLSRRTPKRLSPTVRYSNSRHRNPTHWLVCAQVKVPVGAVWKLLPWNRGLPPTCAVEQVYLDDDVRIAKDTSGQYFVYARPV